MLLNLKKKQTGLELRAAVFRAVRLIEERLDTPPGIAELARTACMSHYHFQRAFHDVVGETVAQFGTRIRIERAASLLRFSAWQVQEITLEVGFSTQASFARAFKRHYNCSPREYRNHHYIAPFMKGPVRKIKEKKEWPVDERIPRTPVRIEPWPDIKVAAIRYHGPVSGVLQPWSELLEWAKKHHPDYNHAHCFGLWFDEWSSAEQKRIAYRYEAAMTLPDEWNGNLPSHVHERVIPAGRVATAEAFGDIEQLDAAWQRFGCGWLPHSGFQPRGDFAFDEYPRDLVFGGRLKQIALGLTGFKLIMCLPIAG